MLSGCLPSSAQSLRSVVRFGILLPPILALAQFSCGATYNKEAFLPAESCYCADISPDGNVIYAAGQFGDWDAGVRLYDASTYEHIKDIHSFPDVPKYILASADGIHLYTTAYYQGAVAKIRVSDGAVVKSISVGPWPVGMVFNSVRRYLYVMVNCPYAGAVGSISIIDTSTDTVVGTIGPIVHAGTVLAISPDDQYLYALSFNYEGSEPQTLYKMTIADRSVESVPGVQVGGISVSPDGQLLYVGDRFAGVVRVFQTSSMTETTPIPIADVHAFWAAPSGDHGLAVCLAPGSSELLIRVVGLPSGEVLQTLSHTLELPDTLSYWPFVDPIFWNRTTGEALIPIFRLHGGVIVLSPAEEPWQVIYQSDFSADPGWTTNSSGDFYWNESAGNYHFKLTNGGEQYSYKTIPFDPVASYQLEFDVWMTRCDWAADLYLGFGDSDMDITAPTTWYVSYHKVDQGQTGSLIYLDSEGGSYHPGGLQPAPFQLNTWYHNVVVCDPAAETLSLRVTKVSDSSFVGEVELTSVGSFAGVDRLYMSSIGHQYASGAVAEGYIDNLVLKSSSVAAEPPVVTQFAINDGDATTESRTVTLNNTTTNTPTHYMASESSAFTGAAWQTYSTAPQFTLSAADGQKTVYFKTKNAAGESNVVSDTITLEEGAWQVPYQTDFSADPGWVTDQPSNCYWNQSAGTYHAKVENNAPAYSPNRYFYQPVTWTGDSFEIQWDIKMTRADWSAGVSFGLFDENIGFAGWGGGQGVCLEFANPDAGRLLWLYIYGGGGLASASSPGGTYAVNAPYICKLSYNAGTGEITAELRGQGYPTAIWSKTLAVPGGFTRPLTKLGGSRSGFGETGYGGVNQWGVAEAEIDNVVFKRAGATTQPPVVTEFAIKSGDATTESRIVTLNNTATNTPTHCMASESSAFTGAAWQTYSTAPQFTLSAGEGEKTVYFKTKNEAGESNVASDTIQLIPSVPQGPEITTTSLPNGVEGRPYYETLQVSGGVAPYTWSIVSGNFPDGLTLDPSTGVISGTPTNAAIGTSTFTVRVADSRSGADAIYVFGGMLDYSTTLSSVEKYDPVADTWTFVSPMNELRRSMGFCTDDHGRVYAIAGGSTPADLQSVERYDPATDVWEYLAPLPIVVGAPAAFMFDGEIYSVGGWMPGYTNRCFIYTPETDTWREGPSVYETFGHAGPVVSLSGIPYLIGGHLDTPSWSIRSAVSKLVREGADLVWKPSTPLQRRRTGMGVTLGLDGLIYAIGGDQMPGSSGHVPTETVERFSEATDAWEYVQPMPAVRAFAGAVTDSSGRIWVVGGTNWSSPFFDSVLRYDPGTDSWTTMTSHLNTGRIGHGIAIIPGGQQTDEQQLSITILPRGPWRAVYSCDFSTDPNWTTDDSANLAWDSATETFHGWQSNLDGTVAHTPILLTSDVSFRLEFDVRINFIEWSAGLTFGLFDSRLMYNAGVVVEYGFYDVGYTIALSAGNPSGPPDWDVVNWETGVWYRNLIAYDAESKIIALEVRRRDDDALICRLSLSGISSFPPEMSFLGVSRIHMAGYNDAAVDFNLDNVVLEEFYEPPKREVEIVPLAGPLLRISWDSEVGKEYQLWATSDLFSGEWIPIGPRMGGTGGKLYVDDYVEGLGCQFYRVETILPVAKSPGYAVVVSQSTAATDGWDDVLSALVSKHSAPVVSYSGSPFPAGVRDELAALHPRYVCFVAQHEEVTDAFVQNVHELTRQLDDDPFGDCVWGIITGARTEDAMRLSSATPRLEIQAGLLKAAGYYLEWLPRGVFHSEGDSGTMWVKESGGETEERTDGPLDDTEPLVSGLNSGHYQLFVTSGHASEYNYQLHWPDPNGEGFFFSYDGQLYANDHNGTRFDINVPQPIIYWAPGNCLIGRIAGPYSMALGWLGSGNAVQFCGYVVPTWYGYMGWGLSDYFLKLQDRFSFAEAFFLTNQALLFDQRNGTPGTDPEGLAYDKNAVAFYGDPALRAIVSRCREPLYNQTIEASAMPGPDQFRLVLTVTMKEDADVPRPVIAFLPFRIVPSETILEQSEAQSVEITDDMVLAQVWLQGQPSLSAGEKIRVTFTCVRAS